MPGSRSYSVATVGCNFHCLHCQNSDISQMPHDSRKLILGEEVTPDEVVSAAVASGSQSVAYTYTEPTIFFEYAADCALLARERGLKNIFVSNGYMTPECIEEASSFLDGANIDLKSFDDDTYKKVCKARLAPVLASIELMRNTGIWVEITTLVIPTINDSDRELTNIAKWIARTDKTMPWHISAFHPTYKLTDLPRTPVETLTRAREIGLAEGLRYVYTGNVPGDEGESTFCYNCKNLIISRFGFEVESNRVTDSKCPDCGAGIDGFGL